MPRKTRITYKDLQVIRMDNYQSHLQAKRTADAHDEKFRAIVARSLDHLPPPTLNFWGVETSQYKTEGDWRQLISLADMFNLPAWVCCSWYWSEAGWKDLEKQWQNLPDPVEKVVHRGVYKSGVVHRSEHFTEVEVREK